jgi:DNA-binding response OmpR family regulator
MPTHPSVLLVGSSNGMDLTQLLERRGFAVTRSETPEDALYEFGRRAIEVVVAVLPLPGLGIAGLCHALRQRRRTPILVVTSAGNATSVDALRDGADDYLAAPCDERVLEARLRALIRRFDGSLRPRRHLSVGELSITLDHGEVTTEPSLPLTPMQSTLLTQLAQHPGVLIADAALADRVHAVHGDTSAVQIVAELQGLQLAVSVASGVTDALERHGAAGWGLAIETVRE